MTSTSLFLSDAEATDAAGAALGRVLKRGDCVFLSGALGAGKSALARAAIQARLRDIGRMEDVPSPSFTLVQLYAIGKIEIRHADLYRLSDPEEAEELGLLDGLKDAILLVEWGERLGAAMPARRLEIVMSLSANRGGRMLAATPFGAGWDAALTALARSAA